MALCFAREQVFYDWREKGASIREVLEFAKLRLLMSVYRRCFPFSNDGRAWAEVNEGQQVRDIISSGNMMFMLSTQQ